MSEKAGLTSKPKFGEWLRGIYASESNPQRDGMYVRTIRRTGRMNPGTFYELTDGNGRFWQYLAQSVERVAAPQPPAEAQAQVGGEVVAWRILWSPQFPGTAELTSDGVRVQKVRALDDGPQIEPLYTAPPSAPVGEAVAWEKGYKQGILDERISEANIGIAGYGAKVEPARSNPYLAQQPAAVDGAMVARFLEAYRDTPGDEAIDADEKVARRWLTAALAAQQGGRSDD